MFNTKTYFNLLNTKISKWFSQINMSFEFQHASMKKVEQMHSLLNTLWLLKPFYLIFVDGLFFTLLHEFLTLFGKCEKKS